MSKKSKTFLSLVIAGVLSAACSRGESRTRQFEVVEEGSAEGVTSAIAGPGEQLAPLTDTNADTTTAFATLPTPPNVDPTLTATDGSLAETLPDVTSGTAYGGYPGPYSRPRQQRRGTIEITRPIQTSTSNDTAPPPTTTTPPAETAQPQPQPAPEAKKDPPKEQNEDDDDEDDEEEGEEEKPPPPPPASPLR